MEYKVVAVEEENLRDATDELISEVNQLLNKGWKLQGGVSVSCHTLNGAEYYNLAQALARSVDGDMDITLL